MKVWTVVAFTLCAAAGVMLAMALTSCSVVEVPTGPGTDYPCGVGGHHCAPTLCCSEFEDCDPATRTHGPACRFNGTGYSAPLDGGAR